MKERLSYSSARQRLYSLEHWGIKLGLENIADFCEHLGNPHHRFLSIHIAGTNGKGSTSAFIDSILRAQGFRVGRYTSPHLRDFRERIHINGRPVSARFVTRFVDREWARIRRRRYSYFEVTTALAFDAFASHGVDIAVVEVGLGGRFDATNIIEPLVSIITRIARDHEHVLGHTAGKIAYEKAGIIKPGVPAVIGPLVSEAEDRIRRIAHVRGAPLWTATEILGASPQAAPDAGGQPTFLTPMPGAHQRTNLATALAAVQLLRAQGLSVSIRSIRSGVRSTQWPARFQIQAGKPKTVFDAGHNPDGISALVETWKQVFGTRKCICVFNTRPDKRWREMMTRLRTVVEAWVFCPMPDSPFVPKFDLEAWARTYSGSSHWAFSPHAAMELARTLSGGNIPILVTGSHYLVGALIPARLVTGHGGRPVMHRVTWPQLIAASQDRGAPF